MAGIIDKLDAQLEELFSTWNIYTTVLATVLILYALYPLISPFEPDTHPYLLARQASPAAIRLPGESAVYRAQDVPHGYPLKTGLNIKDPGAGKWAPGRDGDLRDIWRKVVGGAEGTPEAPSGSVGKILTIRGRDSVLEHSLSDLTKEIVAVGQAVQRLNGTKVAVYLPNSTELLCSVFAAAFYGFTPILIPYHTPAEVVINYMQKTEAEVLIAEAGSLALAEVKRSCNKLSSTIWVVPPTSREIDWTEDIDGITVQTWHEIIEAGRSSTQELPAPSKDTPKGIISIWQSKTGPADIEFTQSNIVAAVAALASALPPQHRINPSDILLPADSLTQNYVLCQTLVALYSNASIALNSQAGPGIDISLVARGVSPTVIVTSPESALTLHQTAKSASSGLVQQISLYRKSSALKSGVMSPHPSSISIPGTSKLRLLYISERAGCDSPPVSAAELHDLRAHTGARVIYALLAAPVAGAVTQTAFYDYRVDHTGVARRSHFGAPLGSVEVKVVDKGSTVTTDDASKVEGEVLVRGPAVVKEPGSNGKDFVSLGFLGRFKEDGTLAYL